MNIKWLKHDYPLKSFLYSCKQDDGNLTLPVNAHDNMSRDMRRAGYRMHMRTTKAQISLRILVVFSVPPFFTHTWEIYKQKKKKKKKGGFSHLTDS